MKNLFLRKRLISAAAFLLVASPMLNRLNAQEDRSDFKKNFTTTLIAKAENKPVSTRYGLSLLDIDTTAEAQEVADAATDTIVSTLLRNNRTLAPLRRGKAMTAQYRKAVRKIAGNDTPVGLHCMRMTYDGIMTGIEDLGIEPEIISDNAKNACATFWHDWKVRFPRKQYQDLWYENTTVYKTEADYNAAMTAALGRVKTPAERERLLAEFPKKNVLIDDLDGSVFLTPRGGGKYHATFYPGRLAKDSLNNYARSYAGEPMFISFNREYIDNVFGNAKTKKISFIARVNAGIRAKVQEGSDNKIKKMNREELIEYLSDGATQQKELITWLTSLPHQALINLALGHYFGKDFEKIQKIPKIPVPAPYLYNNHNVHTM